MKKSCMKNYLKILFWFLVLLFSGCNQPEKSVISGKITNADRKMIYLDELNVAGTKAVDSVRVGSEGGFVMKKLIKIPTFYLLKLSENNFITLLIDSAEKVVVEADAVNFSRDYKVSGSPGSELVKELNQRLNKTKQKLDSISSLFSIYEKSPDFEKMKVEWKEAYDRIVQGQVKYSTDFVSEHPFSMASVLALYQKFDDENYVVRDLQALRVAASALNSFYPESEHVKALYSNTLQLISRERAARVRKFIDEKGQNSPDIILPDQEGKEVALSSFRGKYVLVHFWSALNQDSRIVNPVLVEIYSKYNSRGFEIYQVSVDKEKDDWIEAIANDNLTWTNVGDMKGSQQPVMLYNVQTIPCNYLLDPEGAIISKNLFGPDIDKTLSGIFRQ
jgi:peroxiredoxin